MKKDNHANSTQLITSQVTFNCIALYTILVVSKQLYRDKLQENSLSMMQEDNNRVIVQLKSDYRHIQDIFSFTVGASATLYETFLIWLQD